MPSYGYTFPEEYNEEHGFVQFLTNLLDNAYEEETTKLFTNIWSDEY